MTAPPRRELEISHKLWVSSIMEYDNNRATGHCDAVKAVIRHVLNTELAAARKEEREMCAKVVEREILAALMPGDGALQAETHRKQIAAAIRALPDTTEIEIKENDK